MEKHTILQIPADSDFSIHNIPFGVFHLKTESHERARACTALGEYVIDLSWLESHGYLEGHHFNKQLGSTYFNHPTLNRFMGLTKQHWNEVRSTIQKLFSEGSPITEIVSKNDGTFIFRHDDVSLLMPAFVGDYTDFYSSKNHAYNLGVMFRGKENALQPNWLWLPVGYHGRASSVVVSGTDIHRPRGQTKAPDATDPTFKLSARMDFELEVGHFIGGGGNKLGHPIDVNEADDKIFGLVLMNDLSSRDIQNWEYVPLGPFCAKNLGTIISPWIVTTAALERFKIELPAMEKNVPTYLQDKDHSSYDIKLEVYLKTPTLDKDHLLTTSNFKYMYWTMAQQIAHHTITGCNLRDGDLLGSGTISGTEPHEYGSLIELTQNGKEKIKLPNGEERTFLEDGDVIVFRGYSEKDGVRVGFGECRSAILPPVPLK